MDLNANIAILKPDIVCVTETWINEGFYGYMDLKYINLTFRGSGRLKFGPTECQIYRGTVCLLSSAANRGKRSLSFNAEVPLNYTSRYMSLSEINSTLQVN